VIDRASDANDAPVASARSTTPAVSVVIPTHNRADLLEQAIASVLRQSYQNFEIIVVDDGSTDDTRARVDALDDRRVRYVYQRNQGLAAARNTGIRASRADYIALLDDDDVWLSDKLRKQMTVMQAQERVDVVHCDFRFVDLAGNRLPIEYRRPASRGSLYEDLMFGNVITGSGSAVLIRSSCFDHVGLFDEKLRAREDQDLWRRLALAQHRFLCLDDVLLHIRWHSSNMQKDPRRMADANLQYLEKLRAEAPPEFRRHLPEVAYELYSTAALAFVECGRAREALPLAGRIAMLGPKYFLRFTREIRRPWLRTVATRLSRLKRLVLAQSR
jgi:glycosyltransferase involved in cell wall biosynthesis